MDNKIYKNLAVRAKTHDEVMLFKIKCKVSTVDEFIRMALKALRAEMSRK